MGICQIIYIGWLCFGLGINLVKHGEPRDDYNFISAFIVSAIEVTLLAFGGFFSGGTA